MPLWCKESTGHSTGAPLATSMEPSVAWQKHIEAERRRILHLRNLYTCRLRMCTHTSIPLHLRLLSSPKQQHSHFQWRRRPHPPPAATAAVTASSSTTPSTCGGRRCKVTRRRRRKNMSRAEVVTGAEGDLSLPSCAAEKDRDGGEWGWRRDGGKRRGGR